MRSAGSIKMCSIMLAFVLFLLFLGNALHVSAQEVIPYAAPPKPPDGYKLVQISVTKKNVESNTLTFVTPGKQTTSSIVFSFSVTDFQNLPLNSIWNKTVYLEAVQYPSLLQDSRTTSSAGTSWTSFSTQYALPVTGGKFTVDQLYANSVTGTINTPELYLPMVWNNRALSSRDTITSQVNVGFASQKIKFRADITLYFRYYVFVGTDTDQIKDSILDATDKITGAVNKVDTDINKGFTNVQAGISTINSNLNTINGSIKNGFTDTINNIQSLESSVNAGFTDVINNSNNNTNKITQGITNQTNTIVNNNNQNTQKILDQTEQFRNEDIGEANKVGKIATDFINNTQQEVKSKWEILWYPIEFTRQVLTVFTGGTTTRSYANKYNGVAGYMYSEKTGGLVPLIDLQNARFGPSSGGTTITFPAYTLPVLNVKLWDSYNFDFAQIKQDFPVLFNALYLFSGIAELYMFIAFLRSKYLEIFG